jgi:farnesyl diphosphate synthase
VNSAYELLNTYAMRDDVEPALAGQLIAGLGKAIGAAGLIGGQISDLRPEPSWDVAGITTVYDRKTVSLFTFAVEAGALIGGATACEYKHLMAYAKNLGLAFQLYDDVIDRNGDSANIGKDVHQDSDKPTFVRATCQSSADQALKELIIFATQQIAPLGKRGRLLAELPWSLYRDSATHSTVEDESLVASVG